MAVYQFSALSDGQAISFNPDADQLNFDQTAISAADVRATAEGTSIRVSASGKEVFLLGSQLAQLTTTNVTFANGSVLVFGDNTTAQTADNSASALNGLSGNDHLWGFGGNDTLNGGSGDDWLAGGTGQDNIAGGAGADSIVFREAASNNTFDRVSGFVSGEDRLMFHEDVFGDVTLPGRIVYNGSTGYLYFDADGSGAGRAQLVAILQGAPALAAGDIGTFDDETTGGGGGGGATEGDDTLVGTPGDDTLEGLGGNDSLAGLAGNDSLVGNHGTDILSGGDGDDTLDGAAGFDHRAFEQDLAADTIDGGLGNDVYYVQANDVLSDPGGHDSVYTDAWEYTLGAGLENLTYDPFAWSDGEGIMIDYTGNGLDNVITVGGLWISSSSVLDGGDGDDTLQGSGGVITYRFSAGSGNYGDDVILGEGGTLDFSDARSAVVADLGAGTLSGGGTGGSGSVTFSEMDSFVGGAFADRVTANPEGSHSWDFAYISGGEGNDTLEGAAGGWSYRLDGEEGDDRLVTWYWDILSGGEGRDEFVLMSGGGLPEIVDFTSGTDKLVLNGAFFSALGPSGSFAPGDGRFYSAAGANSGHDADDRLIFDPSTGELYYDADGSGAGASQLIAMLQTGPTLAAADIVVENGASPGMVVDGSAGDDSLSGAAGNDTLRGFAGRDSLNGGAGDDWLEGGTGQDSLTGGDGADSFVFREPPTNSNFDRLLDFTSGTDALRFDDAAYGNIGALGDFAVGDDRFFAGAGAKSGVDAEDRLIYNTSTGVLWYDADGSGAGGQLFVGVVQGAPALSAGDIAVI